MFSKPSPRVPSARRGFTLVELLVVIGIIAALIAMLMPALSRARAQAASVQCKSNMRQVGQQLVMYMNDNQGYLYPMGRYPNGVPFTLGTNVAPHERWPVKVFDLKLPNPMPYNIAVPYADVVGSGPTDPAVIAHLAAFPALPFTPKVLRCPSDDPQMADAHSYILNQHLSDKQIKANDYKFGGTPVSDVVLMGEKKTVERDYYMAVTDYFRIVERFRHGARLGSNYLYLDTHVDNQASDSVAMDQIDPWDVANHPDDPDAVVPPAAGN